MERSFPAWVGFATAFAGALLIFLLFLATGQPFPLTASAAAITLFLGGLVVYLNMSKASAEPTDKNGTAGEVKE